MTLRLFFNRRSLEYAEPLWCLHREDDNKLFLIDFVISTGCAHRTEKSPSLPNLKADYVLKYESADLNIIGGVAYISPDGLN